MSEQAPVSTLPLFADPAPDVRTQAPSVARPGSEDAADLITRSPMRRRSWRRILLYLASQDRPVSREEMSEALDIPQHSLCGRLSTDELRPEWVDVVEQACRAKSGIMVDGYILTPAGKARVARAQEPLKP